MAVPESGGDDQTFAIDDREIARKTGRLGYGARTDGRDAPIVHKNCAVLNRGFCRRRINLGVYQREIRGPASTR